MRAGVGALIFDVDGTLAETEEIHRAAFNEAFAEAGLSWNWSQVAYKELLKVTGGKERITAFMAAEKITYGPSTSDLIAHLHARKTKFYTRSIAENQVSLRPGIESLIVKARATGLKLAIATTTSEENVVALLKNTLGHEALHWFDAICCGDVVSKKKPSPDIFLLALGRLGMSPQKAIAIEDSSNGVRSAVSAGLRVLVTASIYTEEDDFSGAERVFADATHISAWLFESEEA
jgi:HAD superfamily hydrolase (TIGR01509 family)